MHLVILLLVMMGLGVGRLEAQGGLPVTPRTATYPGAPRAVQVLDVTLPSGQHLWFDRDTCRTFAWLDTDNTTTLSNPTPVGDRWPRQDIFVYRNYPGWYSEYEGGLWASEWGTARQPHYQGMTTTPTSVTFTCDFPSLEGTDAGHRYTQALIYTGVTRPAGTGYTLHSVNTAADGQGISAVDIQQTGLGGIGGDSANLMLWGFQGDGYGVQGLPYLDVASATLNDAAFWAIITHPLGWIVVEQPNMDDDNAFAGVENTTQGGHGFTVMKTNGGTYSGITHTTDPIAFLANRSSGRPAPQQYLDARYALSHGWDQFYGLGPQQQPFPREVGIVGQQQFGTMGQMGLWRDGVNRHLDWGERGAVLTAAVGLYITTNHEASGIIGATELESEMYWPATTELAGLVAAPNGQTYTLGTLAQLKDGLDLMRILGIVASYWSQWTYGNDSDTERISHFNLSRHGGHFYELHPEWSVGCPNSCFTNVEAPGYMDWTKEWSLQYWLSQGVQGRFMDTSFTTPDIFGSIARDWRWFNVWYMRQNGFVFAEMPQPWYAPIWYNLGAPYALQGREWGAPFSWSTTRFRYCVGFAGPRQDLCEQDTASKFGLGTEYDSAVAKRVHGIGSGWGIGEGTVPNQYTFEANGHPGHTAAAKAEAFRYGAMQDRYGQPDRIELVNPRPMPAITYPVQLVENIGPGNTATPIVAPDEIFVSPSYQLPWAGLIQIDGEQIIYRKQLGDTGLWAGVNPLLDVTRGANGTQPAAHTGGAIVRYVGQNPMNWDYDDTYWVYGAGSNEVWVKYSDGSVWQRGGSTPQALPTVSSVQVAASGSTSGTTISFNTSVPTSAWVEYDTYGNAEGQNSQRPAEWWPNYLHKTNMDDQGAPPLATSHSRTLSNLTPGATYHYRIVVRGPAQAVTQDATFVAGAQAPTPTPTSAYNITVSGPTAPAVGVPTTYTVTSPGPLTQMQLFRDTTPGSGGTPPGLWTQVGTIPCSGSTCTGTVAVTFPQAGTYAVVANASRPSGQCTGNPYGFDVNAWEGSCGPSSFLMVTAGASATSTPTPTRTATPAATITPTRTATLTPSATPTATPTPVQCIQVRIVNGGEVAEPCP